MTIAGIDYSTRAIDMVFLYDQGPPVWHHYPLEGRDAWERTRSIPDNFPGRWYTMWDDISAIGIEDPRGHRPGPLYRVQGAILACLPVRTLVKEWGPSEWKKAVAIHGNASKEESKTAAISSGAPETWGAFDPYDAYNIARATRQAIERVRGGSERTAHTESGAA